MAESGFRCEYCGQFFRSQKECKNHERREGVKELKIKYPGSIECPKCNGDGELFRVLANSGGLFVCPTCKGKRVVYPRKQEVTDYIPI